MAPFEKASEDFSGRRIMERSAEARLPMTLADLQKAALKLNPSSRARLAEKLLQSLETLSDAEIEQLWASEALRRSEELERGIGTLRDAQEVLRDARSRLR